MLLFGSALWNAQVRSSEALLGTWWAWTGGGHRRKETWPGPRGSDPSPAASGAGLLVIHTRLAPVHPSRLLEGRGQLCRGWSPWPGVQKGDAFLEAAPLSPWSPQGLFPASQVSQKWLKGLVQEAESRKERGPASSTLPCSSKSPALANSKHQCWNI